MACSAGRHESSSHTRENFVRLSVRSHDETWQIMACMRSTLNYKLAVVIYSKTPYLKSNAGLSFNLILLNF